MSILRSKALTFIARDITNRLRFGRACPRSCELIYVETSSIVALPLSWKKDMGGRIDSGLVVDTWKAKKSDYIPLERVVKIDQCIKRWKLGMPWEDTGALDFYKDKGLDLERITRRHEILDSIFKKVKRDRKLTPKSQLRRINFREKGGIRINIGPSGEPVFVDDGTHRLAMALVAEIPVVPAQLGIVHINALNLLEEYRSNFL